MEMGRQCPGSAFSEYFGGQVTGVEQHYRYPYVDYACSAAATAYPGAYGMHGVPRASLTPAYPKPLAINSFGPSPWVGVPTATWDGKTAESLLCPLTGTSPQMMQQTPKRKRKSTPQQRVAANVRERRRMNNLNSAFDRLRRRVPAFPHEKHLSRIQTLRLAMTYIAFMTELLSGQDINTQMKQQEDEANKAHVWQPYEADAYTTQNGVDPNVNDFLQGTLQGCETL